MRTRARAARPAALLVVGAGALASGAWSTEARGELVYAVTIQNFLVSFDSASPGTIVSGRAITGLQTNESVVGIDFRPATGELYAVGSQGGLYVVNPTTGAVAQTIAGGISSPPLMGSAFGVDFNPVLDLLRIVSNADQNLVVNPMTGTVTDQGMLSYPMGDPGFTFDPNVVHLAYTNAFPGAPSTQLYALDAARDTLVRLNTPSSGQLETIGGLGVNITEFGGFDISAGGTAYVAYYSAADTRSFFATINLATGARADVGEVGGGNIVTAITVIPAPAGCLLAGLVLPVLGRRRR